MRQKKTINNAKSSQTYCTLCERIEKNSYANYKIANNYLFSKINKMFYDKIERLDSL